VTVKELRVGGEKKAREAGFTLCKYSLGASQGIYYGEFDPGSERTLAARFKHASRTAAGVTL
jgi:hypothetical protein